MDQLVLNIYGGEECTRMTDPQAHTLFLVKTEKACYSMLIFETVLNQEFTTDRDYFYLQTRCNRIKSLIKKKKSLFFSSGTYRAVRLKTKGSFVFHPFDHMSPHICFMYVVDICVHICFSSKSKCATQGRFDAFWG